MIAVALLAAVFVGLSQLGSRLGWVLGDRRGPSSPLEASRRSDWIDAIEGKAARPRGGRVSKSKSLLDAFHGAHRDPPKPPSDPSAREAWEVERRSILVRLKRALAAKDLLGIREQLQLLNEKGMIVEELAPLKKALAGTLLVTGEDGPSIDVFRDVLSENPDDHESKLHLGIAHFHLGELEEAQAWVDRALADQPENPLYLMAVAEVKATREGKMGLYDAAVASLEERYAGRPPSEIADWREAVVVADALASSDRSRQAARAYFERSRALFGEPDPILVAAAEPLWNYVEGELRYAEGDYQGSIVALVSALTSNFRGFVYVGDLYYRIGRAYGALGDGEKMRANYRLALLNEPVSLHAPEMRAALGEPDPVR